MLKKVIALTGVLLCSMIVQRTCVAEDQDEPNEGLPNIVVILADDLGYGDLSCYGAEMISTPNIDRLASQGMRFTDAHSAASLCSPSRYGMLTGRSPWRLHKKGNGYRLNPGESTIASFLGDNGYRSAAIGKWHLGYGSDWNKPPITGPLEVGFDYHFGVPSNHNDSTRAFIEDHDIYGRDPNEPYEIVKGQDFPSGLTYPRVEDQVDKTLTGKVVDFITDSAKEPFFVYFTPCAPHTHVTPAGPFRRTSKAGLYGDYIQELDSHVGEVLKTLDDLGLTENTLVVFTSDNGGSPKDFKGTQGTHLNLADDSGDIRTKFKSAKADAKKLGHATNGPWHDGKGYAYEGGHRIPFIAKWPGKIKPGTESDYMFNLTDVFATSAEIVGAELSTAMAEDSISLLPVLLGKQQRIEDRNEIFILGNGKDSAVAVCSGKWKLIFRYNNDKDKGDELYDLEADPGELTNLASQHPEIADRLAKAYEDAETAGQTRK